MSIIWETLDELKIYVPSAPPQDWSVARYDIFKFLGELKLPTIHNPVPEIAKPGLI